LLGALAKDGGERSDGQRGVRPEKEPFRRYYELKPLRRYYEPLRGVRALKTH